MSIQEIVVFILITASVTYTVYSFIQVFIKKQENSCGCTSCDFKTDTKDIRSIVHKKLH